MVACNNNEDIKAAFKGAQACGRSTHFVVCIGAANKSQADISVKKEKAEGEEEDKNEWILDEFQELGKNNIDQNKKWATSSQIANATTMKTELRNNDQVGVKSSHNSNHSLLSSTSKANKDNVERPTDLNIQPTTNQAFVSANNFLDGLWEINSGTLLY
ncbi:hypothetical protein RFI_12277 [Reticulomyxa filosa]|uniref:Uncharacterized protein n=1 Tax=Reticulomyxa filosa TaxID=46433 RepID=X6NF07_RETFI|nr:hypothetical protein RFI_12277 [Reticulomyxa filosa]|eukprot:ETO24880.1 hypothetical protein RFI_12277 [Reticulomyxa filosa]